LRGRDDSQMMRNIAGQPLRRREFGRRCPVLNENADGERALEKRRFRSVEPFETSDSDVQENKEKVIAAVAKRNVLLDTIASYRPGFFALPG
jgi:hypothetical protein